MEILKESDDTSIFAWATSRDGVDTEIAKNQAFVLLASSPRLFQDSYDIVAADIPMAPGYVQGVRTAMVFNNKGLHLALPLSQPIEGFTPAILGCKRRDTSEELLAIWLRDVSANGGRYARVRGYELIRVSLVTIRKSFEFRMVTTETWTFSQKPRVTMSDFWNAEAEKNKTTEQTLRSNVYGSSRYYIPPAEQHVNSARYQTMQSVSFHESTRTSGYVDASTHTSRRLWGPAI